MMAADTERRSLIPLVGTLAGVVLGTRVGIELGFPPTNISTFWPANAVLLAALLLLDEKQRKPCLLLAFPAYLVGEIWGGFPWAGSLLFALANCLEVAVAFFVVRRFGEFPFDLSRFSHLVVLVGSSLVAPVASALVASSFVSLTGGAFWPTFFVWYRGDVIGLIVFVPLILSLPAWPRWWASSTAPAKLQTGALFALLIGISFAVYGQSFSRIAELEGAHFAPLPVVVLLSLRLGPKGASASAFFVSMMAWFLATKGYGPFASLTPEKNVESLQLFMASLVLATLAVAMLMHERNAALGALVESNALLEDRVLERTRELAERESQLRAFVEYSPNAISIKNTDGVYLMVNSKFEKIAGANKESILGKRSHEVFEEPFAEHGQRHDRDVVETRKAIERDESLETNGSTTEFLTIKFPVFSERGEVIAVGANHIDVTERNLTEEKLRRSQRLEAVGQLTGGVAHDFNNVLASIAIDADLLVMRVAKDFKARHIAEHICACVERGQSLTARLLAFARQQSLQPQVSDVSHLIESLEELLERTLGSSIKLNYEQGPELWSVLVDPHQFEQALVNLAINARDAMPEGGPLRIATRNSTIDEAFADEHEDVAAGDYVELIVEDAGTGMPPNVLAKAIEPFFTTKDIDKGTGLGLSMVYGFVKQSNGHLAIESEAGEGTTVTLYLPRCHEAALPASGDETRQIATQSPRILLLDDDADDREFSATVLRDGGYHVTEARSGKEAIDRLEEDGPFDLLFTDIMLSGGQNGGEIAVLAERLQPNIRVLYTSGYGGDTFLDEERKSHAIGIVIKSGCQEELLETVREALQGNAPQ